MLKDTYEVSVEQGEDAIHILACVGIVDMLCHSGRGPWEKLWRDPNVTSKESEMGWRSVFSHLKNLEKDLEKK